MKLVHLESESLSLIVSKTPEIKFFSIKRSKVIEAARRVQQTKGLAFPPERYWEDLDLRQDIYDAIQVPAMAQYCYALDLIDQFSDEYPNEAKLYKSMENMTQIQLFNFVDEHKDDETYKLWLLINNYLTLAIIEIGKEINLSGRVLSIAAEYVKLDKIIFVDNT